MGGGGLRRKSVKLGGPAGLVDAITFRRGLVIAEEAVEEDKRVATERVIFADEILLKFDHQRIDVGDISLDSEESRGQLLAVGGVLDEEQRGRGDGVAVFDLLGNDDVGNAAFGGKARDELFELLILLLKLVDFALMAGVGRPFLLVLPERKRPAGDNAAED